MHLFTLANLFCNLVHTYAIHVYIYDNLLIIYNKKISAPIINHINTKHK